MSIFIEHKGSWWRHIDPDTREKTGPEIRGSQVIFLTTTKPNKQIRQPKKEEK